MGNYLPRFTFGVRGVGAGGKIMASHSSESNDGRLGSLGGGRVGLGDSGVGAEIITGCESMDNDAIDRFKVL